MQDVQEEVKPDGEKLSGGGYSTPTNNLPR